MIFTLKMRIVRIMSGTKPRNLHIMLFTRLEIIPLPCEYIFSLMNFTVKQPRIFSDRFSKTQGTGTILIDQLPTLHVFKKVHTILASKYSAVYH
jgi:hypothetical protein